MASIINRAFRFLIEKRWLCANELLRLTGYDYGYLKLSFYGKHHRAPFGAPNAVSIGMIKELSYALSSLELERYKIYAPLPMGGGSKNWNVYIDFWILYKRPSQWARAQVIGSKKIIKIFKIAILIDV